MSGPSGLGASHGTLLEHYDLLLLDLDGVVYVGPDAVPGAAAALAAARTSGTRLAFVTNNAARTPAMVAEHLGSLGVQAAPEDVVTSAQAAARLLAEDLPPGSTVFLIGGEGLASALAEHDLRVTQDLADEPVAVVSGYHPDLRWHTVVQGAIAVRSGLPWVASNTDATIPTPHGRGPGNGVLVGVVADFAEVTPRVAGKPETPLFAESVRRVAGSRPLVVGDRLDTDIEGARRSDLDSLLVLTGVTGLEELMAAPEDKRPTYVGVDLSALDEEHQVPHVAAPQAHPGAQANDNVGRVWEHRGWVLAYSEPEGWTMTGSGEAPAWWQLVATAAWAVADEDGQVPPTNGLCPPLTDRGCIGGR